jgi:hypothetical protein
MDDKEAKSDRPYSVSAFMCGVVEPGSVFRRLFLTR